MFHVFLKYVQKLKITEKFTLHIYKKTGEMCNFTGETVLLQFTVILQLILLFADILQFIYRGKVLFYGLFLVPQLPEKFIFLLDFEPHAFHALRKLKSWLYNWSNTGSGFLE